MGSMSTSAPPTFSSFCSTGWKDSAAVGRSIDAALLARAIGMPERRDEQTVRRSSDRRRCSESAARRAVPDASTSCRRRRTCRRRRRPRDPAARALRPCPHRGRSDRTARRRPIRSSRSAGRRRSAATCGRRRWSSRRRRCRRRCRTCTAGSRGPRPTWSGRRGCGPIARQRISLNSVEVMAFELGCCAGTGTPTKRNPARTTRRPARLMIIGPLPPVENGSISLARLAALGRGAVHRGRMREIRPGAHAIRPFRLRSRPSCPQQNCRRPRQSVRR